MRPDKAKVLCVIALFLPGVTARAQGDPSKANAIADQVPEAGIVHNDHAMLSGAIGSGSYQPLSGKERWNLYLCNAFWSPGVFFRAAGPALGAQPVGSGAGRRSRPCLLERPWLRPAFSDFSYLRL